jgi:hypothetical protein
VKYTLDTNIFIDGFRSRDAQAEVLAFLTRARPFTYLSAKDGDSSTKILRC